ncbi:MAG TPA: PIN domain-containing protein, partial [Rudaea sp.]
MTRGKRIYVLDTNVLMHDPTALFRFEEHDVFLPMTVLEELDAAKKGVSEVSRNARQVSRFINELIEADGSRRIDEGLDLRLPQGLQLDRGAKIGRLYFQTQAIESINGGKKKTLPDNLILASVVALREQRPEVPVVLVSKDINLRIKASIYGIQAEDYENDRALDDFSLLYAGHVELPKDFWDKHPEVRSWSERGHTFYEIKLAKDEDWQPHEFVYMHDENDIEMRVLRIRDGKATLQILDDYRSGSHTVWGISARNREQNFALNALMDPDVDFVTLLGTAGTGKTLLALAAGLAQTMDTQR